MKKGVLLCLLIFIVSNCFAINASADTEFRTISGRLSLPSGEVAPQGGAVFVFYAHRSMDGKQNGGITWQSDIYTIQEGRSYVDYSITLSLGQGVGGVYIEYAGGSGKSGYLSRGYYVNDIEGNATPYSNSAYKMDLSSGSVKDINFSVLKGVKISGKVLLPLGTPNSGSNYIYINADSGSGTEGNSGERYMASATIVPYESNTSNEYTLVVPNDPSKKYKINYSISNDSGKLYRGVGFYNYRLKNNTSADWMSYTPVDIKAGDRYDINMTVLPLNGDDISEGEQLGVEFKESIISGAVFLPLSEAAPKGGIAFRVVLERDSEINGNKPMRKESGDLIIPEGSNFATYSIPIFAGEGIGPIRVKYITNDKYGFISEAYFADNEKRMSVNSYSASPIYLSGSGKIDANMQILKGNKVSGKLSLPSGVLADSAIVVEVSAFSDNNTPSYKSDDYTVSEKVEIGKGLNFTTYSLPVSSDSAKKYKISYSVDSSKGFISSGFYNDKVNRNTTFDTNSATLVDVKDGNKLNINMGIYAKRTISGTVRLPKNVIAPKDGVAIIITTKSDNGTINDKSDDFATQKAVKISSGKNSLYYSLDVPEGVKGGYWVSYSINSSNSTFKKLGWYNSKGSVDSANLANRIDVMKGNKTNIDLYIMHGK